MSDEDEPDERDPFGRLAESAGDREGDPFESLSDPHGADGPTGDADDESPAVGPTGGPGEKSETAGDANAERHSESAVDPGIPSDEPGDPGSRSDDPFSSPDSAFQHVDVGDVDEDDVWEAISEAQDRGSVADAGKRTYAEVSKHRFCEACEHFTGPPAVSCTHEEAEILEFLDMETVRLVDCPIVEERRELQRGENPDG